MKSYAEKGLQRAESSGFIESSHKLPGAYAMGISTGIYWFIQIGGTILKVKPGEDLNLRELALLLQSPARSYCI